MSFAARRNLGVPEGGTPDSGRSLHCNRGTQKPSSPAGCPGSLAGKWIDECANSARNGSGSGRSGSRRFLGDGADVAGLLQGRQFDGTGIRMAKFPQPGQEFLVTQVLPFQSGPGDASIPHQGPGRPAHQEERRKGGDDGRNVAWDSRKELRVLGRRGPASRSNGLSIAPWRRPHPGTLG